jgi:1,4-dihydroxy-2-naphthoyl-CoA synthase
MRSMTQRGSSCLKRSSQLLLQTVERSSLPAREQISGAGGELKSMPTTDELALQNRLREMHQIVLTIIGSPKPVIAAVEGHAYGSGGSLMAACDHVIASESASFGVTFGRVGC